MILLPLFLGIKGNPRKVFYLKYKKTKHSLKTFSPVIRGPSTVYTVECFYQKRVEDLVTLSLYVLLYNFPRSKLCTGQNHTGVKVASAIFTFTKPHKSFLVMMFNLSAPAKIRGRNYEKNFK